MPFPMADPNLAAAPNFHLPKYAEARAHLVNNAIDDLQAVLILANIWCIQNEVHKQQWTTRLEREAQEAKAKRREAEEEEAQHQQALKAEQKAAIKEERKKNKAKYAPIKDIEKIKAGEYCDLFSFTNKGLEEASRSAFTADKDALVMLPSTDVLHKWLPAGAAKDPKLQVIKDENLTWEQFNEAAPRMVTLMKDNDWPDNRVEMHIAFWSALQTHRWCHDFNVNKQHALLLYQAQQYVLSPPKLTSKIQN
ncbi:uncharacterized protein EDB93DRAFT_1243162 [Suillus bovinus]|uniref:uncharacterized protein n=1 Tax=Suillus bovinus TaxID=48563 RepID=UPI001B87A9A3|nr:uncharacterized protein EDB93DRAFT_1243162 [Suillus bovinus]KAG2131311.1 hypothetical protein EDB93DRAFT_1243162 [Suillus bovinus]